MPRITVNNIDRAQADHAGSWGDLLKSLDTELAGEGSVVIAVRFDGVDEPAFREGTAAARALAPLQTLEIDAGTPADLIGRSLGEAAAAVDQIADAAGFVADLFRGHDLAAANLRLTEVVDGLRLLITVVGAAGTLSGVNLETLHSDAGPASGLIAELAGFLETLITAQKTEDWMGVADGLQYDIAPALRNWRGLVDALAAQSMAPATC